MATNAAPKGITVDDAFLKSFLAKGGQAATPTGTPVNQSNVSQFLGDEATANKQVQVDKVTQAKIDAATQNDKAAKLHEKSEEQQKRTAEKEEQAAIKKAEAEEREQELERQSQLKAAQTGTGIARQAVDAALSPAKSLADRIAATRLPPGGIGLLLVIIGVLLFTVVQVNSSGDTRMKQLWYMLNGRTELQGRKKITPSQSQNNSVQKDFAEIGIDIEKIALDLLGGSTSGSPVRSKFPIFLDSTATDFIDFRNLP